MEPITEGKRNLISVLLDEYKIQTADDIQKALKDLFVATTELIREGDVREQPGHKKKGESSSSRCRNTSKTTKKTPDNILDIEDKIISMYAKGLTNHQISETIDDLYGLEVSEVMISASTNKLFPKIREWQARPLSAVFPIVFLDTAYFSVQENEVIRKIPANIMLGVNDRGRKEVISILVGDNVSGSEILDGLKNRGVKDILIFCADDSNGIRDSLAITFPKAEYQRCPAHRVRETLKDVSDKDRYSLKIREKRWDTVSPLYKFSSSVRSAIYSKNMLESLNSIYRRTNIQKSVFTDEMELLKSLYLSTSEVSKKWTAAIRDWDKIKIEFKLLFPGRLHK
ncbi:IS256 family transposase [Parasporobacterium paucivorans]|uniref:Mutator family transposase n=1 Tax=Parasporobacterium paucivorans DSM 15970 TaxID=1122934 RepID=A0A1M6E0W6_9FIRM|nr:transposase [Parasporobacterium paucivorans]SHI79035.1 Transposase (or an inactivated derivative) [Parasporobacterium paucivorans DSM 15970]